MTEDENGESIAEFVERSKTNGVECGRRSLDKVKCIMCDYYSEQNKASFDSLTHAHEKSDEKTGHRFELFQSKLEGYMTKWTMGIVVVVCSGVLSIGGAFGLWQLESVHQEQIRTNKSILALSESVAMIGTRQEVMRIEIENIKAEIKKLMPEHRELMQHMDRNGNPVK